jgi:hypothetical protein
MPKQAKIIGIIILLVGVAVILVGARMIKSPTVPVTGDTALKPPDAQSPAAPVCPISAGSVVMVTINPDIPSPRCVKVLPDQTLTVTNRTDQTIELPLGRHTLKIPAGQTDSITEQFKAYLQPGVHTVKMPYYAGSGPAIWLVVPVTDDFEITTADSEKVFMYTPTSRFTLLLDTAGNPKPAPFCTLGGVLGEVSNAPAVEPPLYAVRYIAVKPGVCMIQSGTFEIEVVVRE